MFVPHTNIEQQRLIIVISWLKGQIQQISKDSLILNVKGVGYELLVSSSVSQSNLAIGQEKELVVFMDVKETSISLFGFSSVSEKEVFLLLKKVKGVGSKLAMGIISSIGSMMVLKAIGRQDVSILTSVSGVGKKGAERIILELREKVDVLAGSISSPNLDSGLAKQIETTSHGQDAILALERLGFSKGQAKQAVETVMSDKTVSSSEILRKALAII